MYESAGSTKVEDCPYLVTRTQCTTQTYK